MKQSVKGLLFLMLATVVVVLLWRQFERLPTAVHGISSSQPQAAALQLLQSWQKKTRKISSAAELFPLPDQSVLLIIERQQGRLPEWQQQALIDWVEGGGRLLTNALPLDDDKNSDGELGDDEIRNHDPLLYHFGVTSWFYSNVGDRIALPLPAASGAGILEYEFRRHCINPASSDNSCAQITCGNYRTDLQYAWLESAHGEALQLDAEPRIDLLHRDLFEEIDESNPSTPPSSATVARRASNDSHDLLLQLDAGDGEVWLLTSLDIFNNDRLHHLDHAALLQLLGSDRQQVWWIQSINVPPLGQWLWLRGWPLISSLLLVLLVFLWQRVPRRGVMLQSNTSSHQDFTDHLRASSALLWRIGQRRALLEPLRRDVLRVLARHPGGSNPQQCRTLAADLSGLSLQQIERAFDELPKDEAALQELVALLQHLRRCS